MHPWITRFRRFMGWNLPKRRLDLEFNLLPPNRRGRKPRLGLAVLARLRKHSNQSRQQTLQTLLEELKAANRYAMSPGMRLNFSGVVLKTYYPLAVECRGLYGREAGIPDDAVRQNELDTAAAIARALTVSYKHVLQRYYDASRFRYARNRKRVFQCASRILELTRLEQRLLGLRYRKLEGRAWQDIHTVFALLASYENVDFPLPTLECSLDDSRPRQLVSPHDLYCAIQAYALLDATTWPVEQLGFIDSYRQSLDKPINATLDSPPGGKHWAYAAAYHDGEPHERPIQPGQGPAIAINYGVLAQSIRADLQALLQSRREQANFQVPATLAPLQDAYRVSIASLMNRNIASRQHWHESGQLAEPLTGLHIYVGFDEIEAHLASIFAPNPVHRAKRQLADSLADRSAMFGEDHTATTESLWQILHSDAARLGLRTQETQFTTPMGIGSLLAYGMGAEDRRRPRLGALSRIYRPQPGTLILEIARLASYAEPVSVAKALPDQPGGPPATPLLAFRVFDQRFGWGLLLPNQESFWRDTLVFMRDKSQTVKCRLGAVKALTHYFTLFGMPEQLQQQQAPEYPLPTETGQRPPPDPADQFWDDSV